MDSNLMREFEELEGLTDQFVDDKSSVADEKEEDDPTFKPVLAASLEGTEIYIEMEHRGLKTTGFLDTDRDILQRAFDEEFVKNLEESRAKRRENRRRAAQQAGLQKRRMLMEKTLQEEQDELARNHQIEMMIEFIKDNKISGSIRLDLTSISARSLAKAMWANTSVTCLDLSSNQLNDHSGAYLARILKKNNTIKKLELDNNFLGPTSCVAFGNSLVMNRSLVYLSLDSNPITGPGLNKDNSGIKSIADALKVNSTLTSLNLWRTGIGSVAGYALAEAVEANDHILFCDVGHNSIDLIDVKRIADKLDSNLAAFEARERIRRDLALTEEQRQQRIFEAKEAERQQKELAEWLQERREQRAEERRLREEQRIAEAITEAEERKRLLEQERERERKAAEEAAAKKAKKKEKAKKK